MAKLDTQSAGKNIYHPLLIQINVIILGTSSDTTIHNLGHEIMEYPGSPLGYWKTIAHTPDTFS
jgi:hypothetical protein